MAAHVTSQAQIHMDRWFLVGIVGAAASLVLLAVAVAGEILHWWGDLGLLLGIVSAVGMVAFGLIAASRFQVERVGAKLDAGFGRVEANTHETVALLRDIRDRLPPRA
jgi:hypothetical protein